MTCIQQYIYDDVHATLVRNRVHDYLFHSVLRRPNSHFAVRSLIPFFERLKFLWTSTKSISQPAITFLVYVTQLLNKVIRESRTVSPKALSVKDTTKNIEDCRVTSISKINRFEYLNNGHSKSLRKFEISQPSESPNEIPGPWKSFIDPISHSKCQSEEAKRFQLVQQKHNPYLFSLNEQGSKHRLMKQSYLKLPTVTNDRHLQSIDCNDRLINKPNRSISAQEILFDVSLPFKYIKNTEHCKLHSNLQHSSRSIHSCSDSEITIRKRFQSDKSNLNIKESSSHQSFLNQSSHVPLTTHSLESPSTTTFFNSAIASAVAAAVTAATQTLFQFDTSNPKSIVEPPKPSSLNRNVIRGKFFNSILLQFTLFHWFYRYWIRS